MSLYRGGARANGLTFFFRLFTTGLISNIPRNIKPKRLPKEKKVKTFGTFSVGKQALCHLVKVLIACRFLWNFVSLKKEIRMCFQNSFMLYTSQSLREECFKKRSYSISCQEFFLSWVWLQVFTKLSIPQQSAEFCENQDLALFAQQFSQGYCLIPNPDDD